MEQNISLRYMRTVQQLERKTEEVEQLLKDAKALDSENQSLKGQNSDLTRRLEEMFANDRARVQEVTILESSHVRKQQQRLQQYIDQEAQAQRQSSLAPLGGVESSALHARQAQTDADAAKQIASIQSEMKALQGQLLESETSRAGLSKECDLAASERSRISADYSELQEVVAELRRQLQIRDDAMRDAARREDGMKATLRHLNQRHVAAAAESREMEEIEAKALEGLKAELLQLEGDNQRLTLALQEERQRYRDAKGEFEKSSQLLARQKALFDAHQKISSEEIQALTQQLEAVLVDMKVSADKAHTQGAQMVKLHAAKAAIEGRPLRVGGSRFEDPESVRPASPAKAAVREEAAVMRDMLERLDASHREREEAMVLMAARDADNTVLREKLDAAEGELGELRQQLESLKVYTSERAATESLRREKEARQEDEIRRLTSELAALNDPTRQQAVDRVEVEGLRDIAAKCLLTASAAFRIMEALSIKVGVVADPVPPPDNAPAILDGSVRSIYNDLVGTHITVSHILVSAKAQLRSRMAEGTAVPREVHSSHRVADVSVTRQAAESTGHRATATHRTPFADRSSGRSTYMEGLSLKDVIDDYRRMSPRRAAHLDNSGMNLRDPLHMAQWELRRMHLLEERSAAPQM